MEKMKQLTLMMTAAVFAASPAFAASVAAPGERADVVRIEVAAKDPNAKGERLFGRDEDGNAPLHEAAWRGKLRLVSHFVISGENPDVQNNIGRTPLHYAVQFKHADVMRDLIKRGANTEVREEYGKTPLHFAAGITGDRKIIAILVDAGANVNARDGEGKTPLHWAITEGKINAVKALLASGADANVRDSDGRMPLHLAVAEGKINAVKALLAGGADKNAKDENDKSPLQVAVYDIRNGDMVEILVKAGADNSFVEKPGASSGFSHYRAFPNYKPLHQAARTKDTELTILLLKAGADINGRIGDNFTPLHASALHNAPKVAKILIDARADLHVRTDKGKTRAMDIAIRKHGGGSPIADTIGYPTTDADRKWEEQMSWTDWWYNCLKHHWQWVCDIKAHDREDAVWEPQQ